MKGCEVLLEAVNVFRRSSITLRRLVYPGMNDGRVRKVRLF